MGEAVIWARNNFLHDFEHSEQLFHLFKGVTRHIGRTIALLIVVYSILHWQPLPHNVYLQSITTTAMMKLVQQGH